jgi:hypothetical protein
MWRYSASLYRCGNRPLYFLTWEVDEKHRHLMQDDYSADKNLRNVNMKLLWMGVK